MVPQSVKEAVFNMRKDCKISDGQRDKGLPTSIPEVERINDLQYGMTRSGTY